MRYIVPQELKPQTQIWHSIYLQDLIFIISFVAVTAMFKGYVHPNLETLFILFNVVVAFLLTLKTNQNPQKRLYNSIYYFIIKDRIVYHPISTPKTQKETEE